MWKLVAVRFSMHWIWKVFAVRCLIHRTSTPWCSRTTLNWATLGRRILVWTVWGVINAIVSIGWFGSYLLDWGGGVHAIYKVAHIGVIGYVGCWGRNHCTIIHCILSRLISRILNTRLINLLRCRASRHDSIAVSSVVLGHVVLADAILVCCWCAVLITSGNITLLSGLWTNTSKSPKPRTSLFLMVGV